MFRVDMFDLHPNFPRKTITTKCDLLQHSLMKFIYYDK